MTLHLLHCSRAELSLLMCTQTSEYAHVLFKPANECADLNMLHGTTV